MRHLHDLFILRKAIRVSLNWGHKEVPARMITVAEK